MYRKLIALTLSLLLSLSLAACTPETPGGSTENQGQSSADTTDPTHFYEEVSDLISVDADVLGRTPGEIPGVYVGSLPRMDQEVYGQFLAALDDSAAEVLTDVTEKEYTMFVTNTARSGYAGFNTSPGFSYSLSYSADSYYPYGIALNYYNPYDRVLNAESDNTEHFTIPKSFAFASPEEADAQAKELLEVLGIQNAVLVETLYLDHTTLAEQEQAIASQDKEALSTGKVTLKDSWTEADDAYHLYYEFSHQAVNLIPTNQPVGTNENYVASYAEIIWGAEGCFFLNITNPWCFDQEMDTSSTMVTAREALDEAIAILNLAPVNHERVITQVALRYYYAQDGDRYLLRPCWNITVLSLDVQEYFMDEPYGEPKDELSYILLDAYTGQEL